MDGKVLGEWETHEAARLHCNARLRGGPVVGEGARAQAGTAGATAPQSSNAPLVGFLNSASAATYRFNADSFRDGLKQAGFIEGQNVRIEERWANGDYHDLRSRPSLWQRV